MLDPGDSQILGNAQAVGNSHLISLCYFVSEVMSGPSFAQFCRGLIVSNLLVFSWHLARDLVVRLVSVVIRTLSRFFEFVVDDCSGASE